MTESTSSHFKSVQSLKRQRRGAAAKVLLALHETDQLDQPENWTWDVIDALPSWCLQDEQTRNEVQLVSGALVLAPELRLWIDRELILAAHTLIGKQCFDHIVAKADNTPIAVNASAKSRFNTAADPNSIVESVRNNLLQAGASVFKASLADELPVDMLPKIIGDTAGNVSVKFANSILDQLEEVRA